MPRAKGTKTRDDSEIMNEKANRIGNILERQLVNLKKMQKNAIKGDSIESFNKMMEHFSNKFEGLKLDESAIVDETSTGFDITNLE